MGNRFKKGDKLKVKPYLTGGMDSIVITYSHYAGSDCDGNHYFYDTDGDIHNYKAWYKIN